MDLHNYLKVIRPTGDRLLKVIQDIKPKVDNLVNHIQDTKQAIHSMAHRILEIRVGVEHLLHQIQVIRPVAIQAMVTQDLETTKGWQTWTLTIRKMMKDQAFRTR